MGEHTGIKVIDLWQQPGRRGGKRYLARYRDRHAKRYVTEAFHDERKALEWARIQYGLINGQVPVAATAPVLLEDFLPIWIAELRRRGRSEDYITESERVIRDAIAHGVVDLRAADLLERAEAWIDQAVSVHHHKRGRPLTASTKNGYLAVLRACVNRARKRRLISHDPLYGLESIAGDRELKPTFSVDQLRALVRDLDHHRELNYAHVVALMVYQGLRWGEAANCDWSWFRWADEQLLVTLGDWKLKRRKERPIVLQPELSAVLRPIAQLAGPLFGDDIRRADTGRSGRLFRQRLEACGVWTRPRLPDGRLLKPQPPAPWTPHSCRHTWISIMLATGENAPLVQAYAGHDSLETTAGYARTQVTYRQAVEDWPRGRLCLRWSPRRHSIGERSTRRKSRG